MVELVSLRYMNPCNDIVKHINLMTALVDQLLSMQASMDTSKNVGIPIASIDFVEMRPVISASRRYQRITRNETPCRSVSSRIGVQSKSAPIPGSQMRQGKSFVTSAAI